MRKLLFFYSKWCPPCHLVEREFIRPLEELTGSGKIVRIDAQNDPFTAEQHQVDKLPAIILLDGERTVMRRTGAIDIQAVAAFLKGGGEVD